MTKHMTIQARRLFQLTLPELDWNDELWTSVESRLRTRRLAAGATLFSLGQAAPALFGVLAGCMETRFSTAEGQVSVVENVEPGHLFGLASFVTGLPSTYEAIALQPTRLMVVDADAYRWLMDEVPGFARALMREFARRYIDTMKLLEAARHRSAEERLCIALRHLQREGRAQPSGRAASANENDGPWQLHITQAELASRANVSRQTANEWLSQWTALGWTTRRYRGLEIHRWPTPTPTPTHTRP